jgi:hypothetical protein
MLSELGDFIRGFISGGYKRATEPEELPEPHVVMVSHEVWTVDRAGRVRTHRDRKVVLRAKPRRVEGP